MRGLARAHEDYYAHLISADHARHGDYDGRGVLNESGLVECMTFLLQVCIDQVAFMDGMLDIASFERRLA